MNTRNVVGILVVVLAAIGLILLSNISSLEACNGGKCAEPLPTQAKACEAPGNGPVHKCNDAEEGPVSTPIPPTSPPPTSEPPATVAPPTPAQEVEDEIVPTLPPPTVTVTVTPTAELASQPASEPACELDASQAGCDACAVVTEALAQGKIIIIADEDYITVLQDGTVVFAGDGVAYEVEDVVYP